MKRGLLLILITIFLSNFTNAQVNENFETVVVENDISISGWLNHNQTGTRKWIGKEYSSNHYAQMSSYSSAEASEIVWLITPNVIANSSSSLNFSSKAAYQNADVFSLWISTDFTGDVASANWTELIFTEPTAPSNGYGDWTASGNIDLSSYNGQSINIAFKYTGGDPGATTTWQIDDVIITGTGTGIYNLSHNLHITPNPVNSVLNINSVSNINQISVSNIIGQNVMNVNNINSNNYSLNVNSLKNGIYMIAVKNSDGTFSLTKFIKE
jgi:hypothetical protein